jgi:rubrerythrin
MSSYSGERVFDCAHWECLACGFLIHASTDDTAESLCPICGDVLLNMGIEQHVVNRTT